MAWGISLTYSKNRSGLKIDPWGTPQEILDNEIEVVIYVNFKFSIW